MNRREKREKNNKKAREKMKERLKREIKREEKEIEKEEKWERKKRGKESTNSGVAGDDLELREGVRGIHVQLEAIGRRPIRLHLQTST